MSAISNNETPAVAAAFRGEKTMLEVDITNELMNYPTKVPGSHYFIH